MIGRPDLAKLSGNLRKKLDHLVDFATQTIYVTARVEQDLFHSAVFLMYQRGQNVCGLYKLMFTSYSEALRAAYCLLEFLSKFFWSHYLSSILLSIN